MKIFGYEITIKKLKKETADSIFTDIESVFRDNYEEDYIEYYAVSRSMYKQIKELAKNDYDFYTKTIESFSQAEKMFHFIVSKSSKTFSSIVLYSVLQEPNTCV